MTLVIPLLLGAGCIWVSGAELAERQEALSDLDDDGFEGPQAGGPDCDDQDAAVHPGAEDPPYDGVDTDCSGGSDYDADGDGHDAVDHGGDDCDDQDPAVHPGAEDAPYDGIDADCAGDSDFDADGDGFDSTKGGGEDCADDDPNLGPGAVETLGDGLDADCDGSDDGFQLLPVTDTLSATGMKGPRLRLNGDEVWMGFTAEEVIDPEKFRTLYDAIFAIQLPPDNPRAYWLDYSLLFWASNQGPLSEGFDYLVANRHFVWLSQLLTPGGLITYVDVKQWTPPWNYEAVTIRDASGQLAYVEARLAGRDDGGFGAVACAGADRSSHALLTTVQEVTSGAAVSAQTSELGGDACAVDYPDLQVWAGDRAQGTLLRGDLAELEPATAIAEPGTWSVMSIDAREAHGFDAVLVADALAGLVLDVGGQRVGMPTSATWARVGVAPGPDGTIYACGVDTEGGAWFAWGDVDTGLAEVALEAGRTDYADCSVVAESTGRVLAAFRTEDDVVELGILQGPAAP